MPAQPTAKGQMQFQPCRYVCGQSTGCFVPHVSNVRTHQGYSLASATYRPNVLLPVPMCAVLLLLYQMPIFLLCTRRVLQLLGNGCTCHKIDINFPSFDQSTD